MQAAPARYVSVSELYSTDEVELLLDEIKELEPTSCRGEEVQDFEIAGSGCEVEGSEGGRSPVGTEVSWDSHAQYRAGAGAAPLALAPLYCARSLRGLLAALAALLAAAAAACAWAAGRRAARPLLLAALTSAPLHAALALLHVSRLHRIMPLPWPHIGAGVALWALLSQAAGAALLLRHVVQTPRRAAGPAPLHVAALALAAGGAAAAAGYLWAARRAARRGPARRGAYRAVPAPGAAPQPPHTPL